MNFLDQYLLAFFNQFSRHSATFDKTVAFLSDQQLFKGGVLVMLVWWAWFSPESQARNRRHLVVTLSACLVAVALARTLALSLPFRLRPIHEPGLGFVLPYAMPPNVLDWSSFPSDHAALFFALSVGLLFVSRTLGALAIGYTVVFIAAPRIYLGLHYPTDILAGALVGAAASGLANVYFTQNRLVTLAVNFSAAKPALFYPLFFLLTYQLAELFNGVRQLAGPLKHLVQRLI
jgi:undecaprenyl-diphosphatase